jgi:hypothetical protein
MSTKIYDGLIAVDKNPFRVQRKLKEALDSAWSHAFVAAIRHTMSESDKGRTWAEVWDLPNKPRYAEWQGPIEVKGPSNAADKLYDLMMVLKSDPAHTFSDLDIAYDAIILPNGRGISKEPLVMVFSERLGSAMRDALKNLGIVREYGYWNNSDRPEGLTAEQWEERRRAWDKLDVPAQDGLSIGLPSRFDAWLIAQRMIEGASA